jgi:hypothetical protein
VLTQYRRALRERQCRHTKRARSLPSRRVGLVAPGGEPLFGALVNAVLGVLHYATFLQACFRDLRRSLVHGRYKVAAMAINFLAVPAVTCANLNEAV